ncbi:MAG: DNA-binding NarL/FixJ family response regulator [Granulosicoccus sp.]|jgi:DNA-binding NarL/FixJ family response regulator
MINVLITDDHEMIRKGIGSLLSDETNVKVIGTASDGSEAVEFCANNEVDVVLMDLQMPIMSGVEATKVITAKHPNTKVLAVTINEETSFITEVLQAGATGYIMKHSPKAVIVSAIEDVANGKKHFSSEVIKKMSAEFKSGNNSHARDPSQVRMTKKEQQVLDLLVREKSNQEIGLALECSIRTIDTHKRNIIRKLGVRNVIGLIKYALKNNLV